MHGTHAQGAEGPAHGPPAHLPGYRARQVPPAHDGVRPARPPAKPATWSRASSGSGCDRRRHDHRRSSAGGTAPGGVSAAGNTWSSAISTPPAASRSTTLREALERLSLNDASFSVPPAAQRRARTGLSAAASLACCTWTSCRSGSNASAASNVVQTAPERDVRGRSCATAPPKWSNRPAICPTWARDRRAARAHGSKCQIIIARGRSIGNIDAARRDSETRRVSEAGPNTSQRRNVSSSRTFSRSMRSCTTSTTS